MNAQYEMTTKGQFSSFKLVLPILLQHRAYRAGCFKKKNKQYTTVSNIRAYKAR